MNAIHAQEKLQKEMQSRNEYQKLLIRDLGGSECAVEAAQAQPNPLTAREKFTNVLRGTQFKVNEYPRARSCFKSYLIAVVSYLYDGENADFQLLSDIHGSASTAIKNCSKGDTSSKAVYKTYKFFNSKYGCKYAFWKTLMVQRCTTVLPNLFIIEDKKHKVKKVPHIKLGTMSEEQRDQQIEIVFG